MNKNIPCCLSGFEHIKRYWNAKRDIAAAKIFPGECYVSRKNELIVTVLGSCISACIRDVKNNIGGMNHFMLPFNADEKNSDPTKMDDSALRYGDWSMEFLINNILQHGGKKENLEVKVFGGANVLPISTNIGNLNIKFITEFLMEERLKIISKDLGDTCSRKILYYPQTGQVKVRRSFSNTSKVVEQQEMQYIESMKTNDTSGEIELF